MHKASLFVCAFFVITLATASAKTFDVELYQTSMLAGSELKAGNYRIDLQGDKVVIKSGKNVITAPVKVEQADSKFSKTSVRLDTADGKYRVQEIRLGGTNMKLTVLDSNGATGSSAPSAQ